MNMVHMELRQRAIKAHPEHTTTVEGYFLLPPCSIEPAIAAFD
jgi:hypothetical protein